MLTLAMTAGNDNQAILVIKITVDASNIFYFSDTEDKITLSSIDFDGKVIFQNSVNEFQKGIDIAVGGGIGQVGTFTFSIARYNSYSGASNFFDDFFPATSGLRLSGKPLEVGIVWEGATTTSEITWLSKHYMDEYLYSFNQIQLKCIEYNELAQREIPHWKIQKETDDKISYFPNAPKDSVGLSIPLVYGNFKTDGGAAVTNSNIYGYAPCILVNTAKNQYIACSHAVYDVNDTAANNQHQCLRWVGGFDTYMVIRNGGAASSTGTTYTNDATGYHFTMFNNTGYELLGTIIVKLKTVSQFSDEIDIENVIDDDETNYDELDANVSGDARMSMRIGESAVSGDVGSLGVNASNIIFYTEMATDGGGNRGYVLDYYNDSLDTPAAGTNSSGTLTSSTKSTKSLSFGNSTTAKKDSTLPWTINELSELDYRITNTETSIGNKIRVYLAYLQLSDIKIITIKKTTSYYGRIYIPQLGR